MTSTQTLLNLFGYWTLNIYYYYYYYIMSEVIKNINNVSLLGFKRIVKTFLWIGIHLHVVFQIAMSVDKLIGL